MKTMMCLLPTASMKPHRVVNQLPWALVLADVVDLNEACQDLQPRQEIFWLLPCSAAPLHHVGFVLLDECVDGTLALHRWVSKHPHMLIESLQMQRNHDQGLMLLKSSELLLLVLLLLVVVVGSVWQESMRSEVEHSWTYLCHLLVFLLCHHHPCLSCRLFLFLFLFSGNIRTHQDSTDLHRPNSLHSSSDRRPNRLHKIHSTHLLHSFFTHHVRAAFSSSFSSAFSFP